MLMTSKISYFYFKRSYILNTLKICRYKSGKKTIHLRLLFLVQNFAICIYSRYFSATLFAYNEVSLITWDSQYHYKVVILPRFRFRFRVISNLDQRRQANSEHVNSLWFPVQLAAVCYHCRALIGCFRKLPYRLHNNYILRSNRRHSLRISVRWYDPIKR